MTEAIDGIRVGDRSMEVVDSKRSDDCEKSPAALATGGERPFNGYRPLRRPRLGRRGSAA